MTATSPALSFDLTTLPENHRAFLVPLIGTLRPMNDMDREAFAGAMIFPDGSEPLAAYCGNDDALSLVLGGSEDHKGVMVQFSVGHEDGGFYFHDLPLVHTPREAVDAVKRILGID